jgi:aspartyl-tRNA(Asn)/glutamyl-tRNA(Gln) amidotransferase subunit A
MELTAFTALELAEKIRNKGILVREALDALYAAAETLDGTYGCYITLCRDEAYAQADEVQALIDAGNAPPRSRVSPSP